MWSIVNLTSVQSVKVVKKYFDSVLLNLEEVLFIKKSVSSLWFKGQLQTKFFIIKEKKSLRNGTKIMKIGEEIGNLNEFFQLSHVFKKHFLTSSYEYSFEWSDELLSHNLPHTS